MAPSVLLPTAELVVAPGATVSTELRVRNNGDIVDEFTFEPLGSAADWISVEPSVVRLFPDTDAVVTVTIAPPREPATAPGPTAWAVKTVPQQHPQHAAVAEGVVVVGEFKELSAELQPSVGHGRFGGRLELAVDNSGNVELPIRAAGIDAQQALRITAKPSSFDAEPGTATFARVKVKPVSRLWTGQPKSYPFQLLVSAQPPPASPAGNGDALGGEVPVDPVVLSGTFVQLPILPKWLLKAALLAGVLLLALFVLWKTLVEPVTESAARAVVVDELEAIDDEVAELTEAVDAQTEQAEQAGEAAATAEKQLEAVNEQLAAAAEEPAGSAGGGVLDDTSNPTNFRLPVAALPGQSGSNVSVPTAADATFALTDIVLQNPGGDAGRLRVLIGGVTILESALENFRDLDYHFISPYLVGPGSSVTVEVDCAVDQLVAGDPCDAAVSFAGFTTPNVGE